MNNRQSLMEILLLSLDQSLGLQNVGKKAKKFITKGRILLYKNTHFSSFLEIFKSGNFGRKISL